MIRETDIRPDRLRAEQARRFAADIARLRRRRRQFVSVACPACGRTRAQPRLKKFGCTYVSCSTCSTMYTNPRPTPTILEWYYRTSENYRFWNTHIFPTSESARRKNIFRPRAKQLLQICRALRVKRRTLLEVGAGFGTFCEEVRRLDGFSRVIAVEPTPSLAETCRRKGLEVIERPIERVRMPAGGVDVVAAFEVIEHLFAPRTFIRACARVLSPGGLLVLTCPNVKGFDIVVLQGQSDTVDVEHLNYFHAASLSHLVQRHGLEVVQVLTPGQLDAELVRKKILSGEYDASSQPFLRQVLIDEWERIGERFQRFIADERLSSHMWLVARKPR
jgi:2-polyprenyl-3-methyl-5-hydroxy-6-metoxy-1,4-benzoquinol methylase